jgi:hypothetical protein
MDRPLQTLPGTGRWQPQADGGGFKPLGRLPMDTPLHRFAVPLPTCGEE